ncbi:MAG: acetoacetate--CoA ligase, partial [Planctomycetes bacterium]|nr:acetoacetate--CoA ligase [Planctomycetota bacterium]
EIYRSVETVPEIADSLVIGRDRGEGDEILLFVVLKAGKALDEALLKRIKDAIRTQNSPRHVPREIHQVKDVPYTISGKKVELAVKNLLTGREVKNRDALKNPEALDEYRRFA